MKLRLKTESGVNAEGQRYTVFTLEPVTPLVKTDGGRAQAGYKGRKDCVCRAISIATQTPYEVIYERLLAYAAKERLTKRRRTRSHPSKGVRISTVQRYLRDQGWTWVPTMQIGSGCRVHLSADELPTGRLIVRVTKHIVAVIDGTIHDEGDPSRDGTRCVYGYWMQA